MKKSFILFILLFVSSVNAQTFKYSVEVQYKQEVKIQDDIASRSYSLFLNENTSLYEEQVVLNKSTDFVTDDKGNKTRSLYFNEEVPTYCFYDFKNKKAYFKEHIVNSIYAVNDVYEDIKWVLKDDTKKIGKYTCNKAVGVFRGRVYTAWYTDDVPTKCGPWKLNGLKGLILEAYDAEGVFKVSALTIIHFKVHKDLTKKIQKIQKEKKLTLKKYIEKWKNRHVETNAYLNSKLPKGAKPFVLDLKELKKIKELEIFK